MKRRTGLVTDERYFTHNVWQNVETAAFFVSGEFIEPDEHMDGPKTKKRTLNLLERTEIMKELTKIKPKMATINELEMCHDSAYIQKVKHLSDNDGGAIDPEAFIDRGTFEIAALSAGGVMSGIDSVMNDEVDNAYVLSRPPGHHATRNAGMGLCLFNNIAIGAEYARQRYGLERIAIIDWDAHHGNGTEDIFYEDDGVLFVSIHQEQFTYNGGHVQDTGKGSGEGYNINIPFPAGTGNAGYTAAFKEIVEPVFRKFQPELILISAGQDSSIFDPIGRMRVTSDGYRNFTKIVVDLAEELCGGKILFSQEGGYNPAYAPFCTLAIIEEMSGIRTAVTEDPFLDSANILPIEIKESEEKVIEEVKQTFQRWFTYSMK
ncbi:MULTISPECIES: class II histone deacetylase [unclassified Sporosarcina]|uniref:class II histone deacetylase n=1 Tax=unclassified Sporosarcina TaxID=2647733 RepID=UPI00203FE861|nr:MULTISPECIES: class II histone deacetylase [unclassified Sporosarcina]GKV67359.1 class II histone deacetylase [Sporosarcina sp. NCCP-2331]GLB57715.1 class II histone deacetylase [Sporosarcina sp. NCCP-2378]